ncbi:unnamed protein product [Clonostachys rhizophaga]|uniref:CHAT domain-containing protein n=1 Tax=Clonostachys rhizophaga TaxID=160324 RepID=A0A9N9YPA4_9HYPO|nr:unnamed protein product [Clonostachys rhizophaga]
MDYFLPGKYKNALGGYGVLISDLHPTIYTRSSEVGSDIAKLDFDIQQFLAHIECPGDASTRASRFEDLGRMFFARWIAKGAIPDLENSIKNHQAALTLTQPGAPLQTARQAGLSEAMRAKVIASNDKGYTDVYIQSLQDLFQSTGSKYLLPLAEAYGIRLIQFRDAEDLDKYSDLLQEVLDLPSSRGDLRRKPLMLLGQSYVTKHEVTGDLGHLDACFELYQEALDIPANTIEATIERTLVLQSLGEAFRTRWLRLGDPKDAELSLHWCEEAVNTIPVESAPIMQFGLKLALASCYVVRFAQLQSTVDIDISIRIMVDALRILPENEPLHSSGNLQLARLFQLRYGQRQGIRDLDQVVSLSKKAAGNGPHNRKFEIQLLLIFAKALNSRYSQLGHSEDIDESIEKVSKALSLTQDQDEIFQPELLDILADSYEFKYKRLLSRGDLEMAISYRKQIITLLPTGHSELPTAYSALGSLYDDKSEITKAEEDYEMTLQTYQKAVDAALENDPIRIHYLRYLGIEYQKRFQRLKIQSDLDTATRMLDRAFRQPQAPIMFRIFVGKDLADWLIEVENPSAAYQVATEILPLLSQFTPRSLEISDKQSLLGTVAGIPSIAAGLALIAGEEPYTAIQHLESERGNIVTSLSDLRVDTIKLNLSHPHLAEQFIQLKDELDSGPGLITGFSNPRHHADRQLASIIEEIRELPGFNRFLLPPSKDDLMSAAIHGPIVIINMMFERCDALIIKHDQIICLKLPELEYHDVAECAAQQEIDQGTLEWLWDTTAHPILENLGYLEPPTGSPWPRVFWVPTGPLISMPIHAAGYHYPGSNKTVLDCVVSVYSFSVRALLQGRMNAARAAVSSRPKGEAVLIGVQNLPFASDEIDRLEELCTEMNLQTKRVNPYRSEALASLSQCEIYHFAGHGATHPVSPLRSSLKMNDEPVTVQDLFNMRLHEHAPFLAYLSACSTGRIEDESLLDEGLHLISACQLAGFQNVIGTLQKANDLHCSQVAKMTYTWIKNQKMEDKSVAEGLHHAIRNLRDQWIAKNKIDEGARGDQGSGNDNSNRRRDIIPCEEQPIFWAPFVCFSIY